MPWIENCAASDVRDGFHSEPDSNTMLIQIMDPPGNFPTPNYKFKETHQFDFLDIEDDVVAYDPEMYISETQAKELVRLLKHAYENGMNVVVHCYAGVSRSGAVAEVGRHIGFDLVDKFRDPNTRMMRLMLGELGIPYEVKPHNWRENYRAYLGARFD